MAFRASLAGDGPERGALENLAVEHGVREALSFPGWVTDKSAFFAGIDLFCLPSHHEPFGIVLIEAMAHGLAIVATDSEGPTQILHDGIDGMIVPRGDAVRLARVLEVLIADRDTAETLGANAYRHVLATYDVPRVGARLDLAVRDVVERAGRLEATG
jgi:glycosyltransferase involved in cell wall biosynthesis